MKSAFAFGALLSALASVLPAGAQTSGSTNNMALELTAQQRAAIYRTVMQEKVRTPPPANTPVAIGAQIHPSTELYALPDAIAADAPSAKLYKYTVAQSQVVIVDPTSMRVVDVIRP